MKTSGERKGESRHGKHDPDSVLLGMHAKPELKALANLVLTMDKDCNDISDVIEKGIRTLATGHGILLNGEVKPEFVPELRNFAAIIRETKKQNQQRAKARAKTGKDR